MQRTFILLFSILGCTVLNAQATLSSSDSAVIMQKFWQQEAAWNRGDIEDFMTAYWESTQLVFVGADGSHYGWKPVKDNYYKRYPDRTAMGTLTFEVLDLRAIDQHSAFLIGTYHLTRTIGNLRGTFTLVWSLIEGKWVITSDHTSAFDLVGALKTQLDPLMASHFSDHAPGGALLIAQADQVLYQEGFGLANLQTKEKISEHTVFNTGSISKTFVSNAILKLQEDGLLSLDDPIAQYFDFEHPEVVKDVAIKHLLSHTSGLPDLRNVGADPNFYLTAKDRENFAPLLKTKRLRFPPGSAFEYSNPAYNGLALIVEEVSGMPWQDFVKQQIFDPADMTTSRITNGSEPSTDVAHAYVQEGQAWSENDYGEFPTFCAAGNGGIWSSVVELFHYEQAQQKGKFLSLETIAQSRTPFQPSAWSASSPPFVGYGWWSGPTALFRGVSVDRDVIFHTGSQGGFRGYHIYFPNEKIFIAALFNRPVPAGLMQQVVDEVLETIP
ncbi:MAG: class A beta-lactamase-related serine hydrolase [Saprospiraceae bacterium]|nr:class A beta-lactamase-related serine hydrolase [Saprospiraceae bacterium]